MQWEPGNFYKKKKEKKKKRIIEELVEVKLLKEEMKEFIKIEE